MAKKARIRNEMIEHADCACVIHGSVYDWSYVERLHAMLIKHSSRPIRLHVFTEATRTVPEHMTKHVLTEWPGINGTKKSWWYKMQMFNPEHFQGRFLYFDLDVVITRSIDWVWGLSPKYFWAVHDFRYLWKPTWKGMNSSMMYWDQAAYRNIWREFSEKTLDYVITKYHGDQDYLNDAVDQSRLRFFPSDQIKSWRWQIKEGGMDPKTRVYKRPGAGSILDPLTSVMIFHGKPKPHEIDDTLIFEHWKNINK